MRKKNFLIWLFKDLIIFYYVHYSSVLLSFNLKVLVWEIQSRLKYEQVWCKKNGKWPLGKQWIETFFGSATHTWLPSMGKKFDSDFVTQISLNGKFQVPSETMSSFSVKMKSDDKKERNLFLNVFLILTLGLKYY